jgi:hypothetical protein
MLLVHLVKSEQWSLLHMWNAQVAVLRSSQLRQRAADFRFYEVDELPHKEPQKSLLKYKVVVLLSLLAFSGLFLASHERILCDSD